MGPSHADKNTSIAPAESTEAPLLGHSHPHAACNPAWLILLSLKGMASACWDIPSEFDVVIHPCNTVNIYNIDVHPTMSCEQMLV